MPEPKPDERIVLKILGGVQAGAEVSLPAGEYSLGSGLEDDIQFIDVSMKPGHARLRVALTKIEIRSGTGTLRTANGVQTGADDDAWQEVQPLDVVTTGTTRFALGPPTAQWSTITEDPASAPTESSAKKKPADAASRGLLARARPLAVPISLLGIVLLAAISFLAFGQSGGALTGEKQRLSAIAATRAALDRFPFGRSIVVKQDVDGVIFAKGYVESDVERRAIVGAIGKTGIPVRLRLGVLQVLRSELVGLIKAEKVDVRYQISPQGNLTLDGTILEQKNVNRFLDEVRENVLGLNKVTSKITTANALLVKIEKLAELSQIKDSVVFRLDQHAIDANGVISVNKIDQWVGFLQAYSKRFSKDIGLRSYVQLQYDPSSAVVEPAPTKTSKPILLGAGSPSGLGGGLDIGRLKSGNFKLSDVFAGVAPPGGSSVALFARQPVGAIAAAAPPSPSRSKPGDPLPVLAPNAAPHEAPAPLLGPIAVRSKTWRFVRANTSPISAADPRPSAAMPPVDPPPVAVKTAARPATSAKENKPKAPMQIAMAGSALPSGLDPPTGNDGKASENEKEKTASPILAGGPTHASGQAAAKPAGSASATPDKPKENATDKAAPAADPPGDSGRSVAKPTEPILTSAPQPSKPKPLRLLLVKPHDVGDMTAQAVALMTRWTGGELKSANSGVEGLPAKSAGLESALDTLANESLGLTTSPHDLSEPAKELFARKYLPLFALSRRSDIDSVRECRAGSRLSLDNLPAALFWLDVMSTTNAVTLADFDLDAQGFILEAALNPDLVAKCLKRTPATAALISSSIYLAEAGRNPQFVRFVTSSLQTFPLDVTGASLSGTRFIQLRDGKKLREGAAPDAASRIDSVGELGVSVLLADGFGAVIYGPNINWMSDR
ncbi:MAG TPA: FHA domain-containing protein [Beijerinckiaceae bacterium]|nr:FHA domain-containing protein [Beijerinckiaceae bacterium]